jgi:1-acyl-sn-glycerol-3-phosphate acyltransferase
MEKWYKFCQMLGRAILFCWLITVKGKLPEKGALVCVANHFSFFDPALLGIFLNRRVWFLAKKRILEWFILGWLIKKSNWALPVSKNSMASLRETDNILKNNGAIVIFPEGTRNKSKLLLKKPEKSFARIAIQNKAPIVCLAIIRRRKKIWWLPKGLKIVVSEPSPIENDVTEKLIAATWQKLYLMLSQG